jgi:double-stranded uracil-DNA glycosylase
MLDDLLAPDLRLVICGSAAGFRSAERQEYYAGQGNQLWSTLAAVGLTPRQLSPGEYRQLLDSGIGLTDMVKGQAGGDIHVRYEKDAAEVVREKIERYRPRIVCFNGKRAARAFLGREVVSYGQQQDRVGSTILFVAPSTSGAARGYWSIEPWREVARLAATSQAAI